jgi:hypothetical protein
MLAAGCQNEAMLKPALFAIATLVAATIFAGACAGESDKGSDSPTLKPMTYVVAKKAPYATPESTTVPVPSFSLCTADDLRANFLFNQGATGNWVYNFTLENISAEPCSMDDLPLFRFSLAGYPEVMSTPNTRANPRRVVDLPPGDMVAGIVTTPTEATCNLSLGTPAVQSVHPVYYDVYFELPGGELHVDLHNAIGRNGARGISPYCGVIVQTYY